MKKFEEKLNLGSKNYKRNLVNIKCKTIDLLKNHIYSKNEAFHEYFTSSS